MHVHCRIVIHGECPGNILASVRTDNEGYVDGFLEDDGMVFTAEGPIGEVRNSVNDLLGCLRNAMGVVEEFAGDE